MWFNNDFYGTTYSAVSWGALVGGVFAVWLVAVPGLERITTPGKAMMQGAWLTAMLALAFVSHVQAMCVDPGAVPVPASAGDGGSRGSAPPSHSRAHGGRGDGGDGDGVGDGDDDEVCHRCDVPKPLRAHHCRVCDRCINGMDHHCPWVNNCVGDGNRKAFCLFLLYTCAAATYGLLVLLTMYLLRDRVWGSRSGGGGSGDSGGRDAGVSIGQQVRRACGAEVWLWSCLGDDSAFLQYVLSVALAAGFAVFTALLLLFQLRVVVTGRTNIDRYKGVPPARRGGVLANLTHAFGPPLRWLVPDGCGRVCVRRRGDAETSGRGGDHAVGGSAGDGGAAAAAAAASEGHYPGSLHEPRACLINVGLSLLIVLAAVRFAMAAALMALSLWPAAHALLAQHVSWVPPPLQRGGPGL